MRCRVIRSNLLLSLLLLAVGATAASGASVSLAPSKDNSIIQVVGIDESKESSGQLSNGQGDIFVGRTNQDGQTPATISIRRGLIAFNVAAAIPAGATITSVSLTMVEGMGNNGPRAITLHRTTADWGEGASFFNGGVGGPAEAGDATWFYRSYATAVGSRIPWTTPGGDFETTASASSIVTAGTPNLAFTWSSATNPLMISDVQQWLDAPGSNFGWTIRGVESEGQTAKRFRSGESATPPSLKIEYVVVPEPSSAALCSLPLGVFNAARRRRG